MLDVALLMYMGLLVLGVWRLVCFYRCCGVWLSFLNYTSILYVMLIIALGYSMKRFFEIFWDPLDPKLILYEGNIWKYEWLRQFVLYSPGAVLLTLFFSWFQAEAHIFEIRKYASHPSARSKHDIAVQIIALPAIFGVMVMAGLVPILELATGNFDPEMQSIGQILNDFVDPGKSSSEQALLLARSYSFVDPSNATKVVDAIGGGAAGHAAGNAAGGAAPSGWKALEQQALWRYETCIYVADLVEAWALYQFGRLALDLIQEAYQTRPDSKDILAAHNAVTSLTWIGTMTFVMVCLAQTGCSLWPYFDGEFSVVVDTDTQEMILAAFQVAGFFASCAAIYNIFIVEFAYHSQLASCSPFLKFISVKVLVSLAFFQAGILYTLHELNRMLPGTVQRAVRAFPLLGDLLNLGDLEQHMFYAALMLYECLFVVLLHCWAWSPDEGWYGAGLALEGPSETDPLMTSTESYDAVQNTTVQNTIVQSTACEAA
jgi:hypothetical protein